jgi:hypothetical protein
MVRSQLLFENCEELEVAVRDRRSVIACLYMFRSILRASCS